MRSRCRFAPRSFDYVFSSLFLHHFTDEQVVELLAGFGRVARKQVLVIDLWRHPVPYYFISRTRWLFGWHPVTVNDGAISVEAAFRPQELIESGSARGVGGSAGPLFCSCLPHRALRWGAIIFLGGQ